MQLRGRGAILDALQRLSAAGGGHVQCFGGSSEHGNRVSTSEGFRREGKVGMRRESEFTELTGFERGKIDHLG